MHPFNAATLSWNGGGDLIVLGTSDGIEVCCNLLKQHCRMHIISYIVRDVDTACVGDHALMLSESNLAGGSV